MWWIFLRFMDLVLLSWTKNKNLTCSVLRNVLGARNRGITFLFENQRKTFIYKSCGEWRIPLISGGKPGCGISTTERWILLLCGGHWRGSNASAVSWYECNSFQMRFISRNSQVHTYRYVMLYSYIILWYVQYQQM